MKASVDVIGGRSSVFTLADRMIEKMSSDPETSHHTVLRLHVLVLGITHRWFIQRVVASVA